jgi:hypothetical protein
MWYSTSSDSIPPIKDGTRKIYDCTDESEKEFSIHRLFLHTILTCEYKTSKYEIDKSSPYPHTEIFEIPDRNGEDSTEIISH